MVTPTIGSSNIEHPQAQTAVWISQRKKNSKNPDDVITQPNSTNTETAAPANDEAAAVNANSPSNLTANPVTPTDKKKPKWAKEANHGRYGFDDYPGLDTVVLSHQALYAGAACPHCQEANQTGKVYPYEAGSLIRLIGQPLVSGTRYQLDGLRCHLCSTIFKPEIPAVIANAPKFAPSAVSNIAIGHYSLGLPFNRIEDWQRNGGVPLPDATQYDEMAKLTKKVSPVVRCMETLSADSQLMHYDNSPLKILALGKGQGTAIVSMVGSLWIYLFYTNQHSAGKNASTLLSQRTSEEPLMTMTDAAKSNELSNIDEILFTRLIIAFCLVHGRRKFHELLDMYPEQCGFVVEAIADVYKHEEHCQQNQLSPAQRLLYHQTHSGPVMENLKIYLTNLYLYGQIERNSALSDAISYMLKRWTALTRFLQVEGCPLDNNICERAIKILIRYRKNSFFYRSIKGALCGDTLMSLIYTATRNGVNAFQYLNALQEHEHAVAARPQDFLPWNYQGTLQAMVHHKAA